MTRDEIFTGFAGQLERIHNERNAFMDDMIEGLSKVKDDCYAKKEEVIDMYCNTFLRIESDYKKTEFLFERMNEWAYEEDGRTTDASIEGRMKKEGEAV